MPNYAVIGLGFGDEGKGACVNSLCQKLERPLVVRYSGGQQAGHTVHHKNIVHTFSNFGSGTLRGAPTYWSKYCTFDPVGFLKECAVLNKKGVVPKLYLDRASPLTTPMDKFKNQLSPAIEHGTCGVGVGATFRREENFYSLLAEDLLYPEVLKIKLQMIKKHYADIYISNLLDEAIAEFLECCSKVSELVSFSHEDQLKAMMADTNIIFEGSQGLMLDPNIGFFPHVTSSNTGTKNILAMVPTLEKVYLVTRAFQTRHGEGPMTNDNFELVVKGNPYEINVHNKYQGDFRKTVLDLDLLKYTMNRDPNIQNLSRELVITCLDLMLEYKFTIKGELVTLPSEREFLAGISEYLHIRKVHTTYSPFGGDL